MQIISSNVKIIVIILCCLIALFLIFIFRNDILWILNKNFSEATSLNYPTDILTVWISGSNFEEKTKIENQDDIDTLIEMLNSLQLVERKGKKIDYSKPYIDLITDIQETDSQKHYGYDISSVHGSHIVLSGHYIFVYPTNYENIYYRYYVKNPNLSFQDGHNGITQYLHSLVEHQT